MRRSTQIIAAALAAGALILSACGSSDSESRQRNSSIAKDESGLTVDVWQLDTSKSGGPFFGYSSMTELTTAYLKKEKCANSETRVDNIAFNVGAGTVANCASDFVLIHYSGFINIPGNPGEERSVRFSNLSDDGFWLSINNNEIISDWGVKWCKGTSGTVSLPAQTKLKFDAWYFENTENSCNVLYWRLGKGSSSIIPVSAFAPAESKVEDRSDDESSTTTTATSSLDAPTTSTPAPTTTVKTTSTDAPTTTVKKTDISIAGSTTTTSEGSITTTSTSATTVEDTSTTQVTVVKEVIVDDTTPITVPEGIDELPCDLACVESIRITLDVTGDVYATVDGKTILLDGKTPIPATAKEVVFSDGADKSVAVALESIDTGSGENSPFPWIIVIIAIVIIAGGGYVAATRKKKEQN